jgi:hypothetical protein
VGAVVLLERRPGLLEAGYNLLIFEELTELLYTRLVVGALFDKGGEVANKLGFALVVVKFVELGEVLREVLVEPNLNPTLLGNRDHVGTEFEEAGAAEHVGITLEGGVEHVECFLNWYLDQFAESEVRALEIDIG